MLNKELMGVNSVDFKSRNGPAHEFELQRFADIETNGDVEEH